LFLSVFLLCRRHKLADRRMNAENTGFVALRSRDVTLLSFLELTYLLLPFSLTSFTSYPTHLLTSRSSALTLSLVQILSRQLKIAFVSTLPLVTDVASPYGRSRHLHRTTNQASRHHLQPSSHGRRENIVKEERGEGMISPDSHLSFCLGQSLLRLSHKLQFRLFLLYLFCLTDHQRCYAMSR
jgi:hypothetical protein